MKKIIEYKVVASTKLKDFNIIINRLIKEGWQPDGTARINSSTSQYYQTMIKFQEFGVQIVNDIDHRPFYDPPFPGAKGDNMSSTKYFEHLNPISSSGMGVKVDNPENIQVNNPTTMYDAESQETKKIKRDRDMLSESRKRNTIWR